MFQCARWLMPSEVAEVLSTESRMNCSTGAVEAAWITALMAAQVGAMASSWGK